MNSKYLKRFLHDWKAQESSNGILYFGGLDVVNNRRMRVYSLSNLIYTKILRPNYNKYIGWNSTYLSMKMRDKNELRSG